MLPASLKVTFQSPEQAWPITRLAVLGADLHIHVIAHLVQRFCKALVDCAYYLDYNLKDDAVPFGSGTQFDFLGYTVVNGLPHLDEQKFLATLLLPERYIRQDFIKMQSMRAIGTSYICRDKYPLLERLLHMFCERTAFSIMTAEDIKVLKRQCKFRTLKIGPDLWGPTDLISIDFRMLCSEGCMIQAKLLPTYRGYRSFHSVYNDPLFQAWMGGLAIQIDVQKIIHQDLVRKMFGTRSLHRFLQSSRTRKSH